MLQDITLGLVGENWKLLQKEPIYHITGNFIIFIILQEGNNFGTEYHDYTYINNPLLRIKVIAHPGSTNLIFEPTLDHTRVLIMKWFHTIINVNAHLPSVDKMMYPGKKLF